MTLIFKPRPQQDYVLNYSGGTLGVSAVPGSGKTWTLSHLAANIIARQWLAEDQEVLVVTLVNSSVDNFSQRVGSFLKAKGLLPNLGYRVRTLHGLANDIVRERPELVGLDSQFQIIDEREIVDIQNDIARAWLRSHPISLDGFIDPDLEENKLDWIRREKLPEMVKNIASQFIKFAKDREITPQGLHARLTNLSIPLPLAQMGLDLYTDYQRALAYRGAVDFSDLIRLALKTLELDEKLLTRLRYRWPYILEDEAQDSSMLQEKILRLLAEENGNWVRVGDPNQAIYETFTTADPKLLQTFQEQADYSQVLPHSGRSTRSIIKLANHLVDWTRNHHSDIRVRDSLQDTPIETTLPGDPQPNPMDDPSKIYLVSTKYTPAGEASIIASSLQRWLPNHPEETVAVLVPRNERGYALVDNLRERNLEYVDSLLKSTSSTRTTANSLGTILSYLSNPQSIPKLAAAYEVWRKADNETMEETDVKRVKAILRKCQRVEDFLFPRLDQDWLEYINLNQNDTSAYQSLMKFRDVLQRWQMTILLPIDQIILTLAQDLFTEPADLALAHKLAVLLRRANNTHQDWRLPQLSSELTDISRNQRRFLGLSDDDTGFDPERYRGKVVISTIHKAKGLEWDRVYIMSVNNYDFPSSTSADNFIADKWFARNRLNPEAETLAQLEAAFSYSEYEWYQEGTASEDARVEYVRERLRLLYVAITRAKKDLIITWNSGRKGICHQALPFVELSSFWEEYLATFET